MPDREEMVAFTPEEMFSAIKGMWDALRPLGSEEAVKQWLLSRSEPELARLYSAAVGLHVITAMMEHDIQKAYAMKTGVRIQMEEMKVDDGTVIRGPQHGASPEKKDVLAALFGGGTASKQVA